MRHITSVRQKKRPPSLEALYSKALGEIRTPYPWFVDRSRRSNFSMLRPQVTRHVLSHGLGRLPSVTLWYAEFHHWAVRQLSARIYRRQLLPIPRDRHEHITQRRMSGDYHYKPHEKWFYLALADNANDEGTDCWPSVGEACRKSAQWAKERTGSPCRSGGRWIYQTAWTPRPLCRPLNSPTKEYIRLPRSRGVCASVGMKADQIRAQGQIENMLKAWRTQAFDIVRIPGEQGCPGADTKFVLS